MPQDNNLLTGLFIPNLNMITLNTGLLTTWGPIDMSTISAGVSTTSAGFANDRFFGIRLRVRQVGNPTSETAGGECQRLAVDNTLYNGVSKGGPWASSIANGQLAVAMVDVEELLMNGCVGIETALHVRLTAAHPNLGQVSLSMNGPGSPYNFTLPAPIGQEVFGIGTNGFVVPTLSRCAYIVTLATQILLTTGDAAPDPVYDQLAFCTTTHPRENRAPR